MGLLFILNRNEAFAQSYADIKCPEPSKGSTDMVRFRSQIVEKIIEEHLSEKNPALHQTQSINAGAFLKVIDQCFNKEPAHSKYPPCLNNLREFLIQNLIYFHETVETDHIPVKVASESDVLTEADKNAILNSFPKEFTSDGSTVKLPDDFRKFFTSKKDKKWDFIEFETLGHGGFDGSTRNLALVHIPALPPGTVDWFIQFGVNKSDTNNPKSSHGRFAAIALDRKDGKTTPYFFMLNLGGPPDFQRALFCKSCHPNGVRVPTPADYIDEKGKVTELGRKKYSSFFSKIQKLENPLDWRDHATLKASTNGINTHVSKNSSWLGPHYGSLRDYMGAAEKNNELSSFFSRCVTPTEDGNEYTFMDALGSRANNDYQFALKAGAKPNDLYGKLTIKTRFSDKSEIIMDSSPVRWEKVKQAMNCTLCHSNGQGFSSSSRQGLTNYNLRSSALVQKVLRDRTMPPIGGDDLSIGERIALVKCLEQEEKLTFPYWLRDLVNKQTCENPEEHKSNPSDLKKSLEVPKNTGTIEPEKKSSPDSMTLPAQ